MNKNLRLIIVFVTALFIINTYPIIYLIIYKSFDLLWIFNICGIIIGFLGLNILRNRKLYLEARKTEFPNYKKIKRWIFIFIGIEVVLSIGFAVIGLLQ